MGEEEEERISISKKAALPKRQRAFLPEKTDPSWRKLKLSLNQLGFLFLALPFLERSLVIWLFCWKVFHPPTKSQRENFPQG